ncbi:MAG: hypothetical protein IJY61_06430, partial [Candidatus Gastranaerophilales bacterium]|nr:hypothetical protein [Candidatus Gastranaerophilales bacterium]
MKINCINKISNNYHIQSFSGETKKEKRSFPNLSGYTPYTLENMQANYLLAQKIEQPTLKNVLKKHNLPKDILKQSGYTKEDVSQDMIKVFDKLSPKVIEHILETDQKGDLIAKLLTESGEFETFWDYQGIPNLLNLFNSTRVNGETLLSQLDDFSFMADEDFDVTEWELFISTFDSKKGNEEKTYLEKFLGKNSFAELFYSKEFSPSDILEVRDKIETSIGCGNFVPNRFFEIMDLLVNSESSKYSQTERTQALNYFIGLEDKSGKRIFNVSNPRHSKLSTYNYFMNIDPSGLEASNIQMLIELVQEGVVGKHIFEYLPLDSKINSNISSDIDKLYSAYINGIEPIDKFIPTYDSSDNAQKDLKIGDIYEIDGEDFIYIVNDKHSSTQLQLTKEKYFELFPPVERFGTTQNQIGNCWEISVLQGLYCNPKTRHLVLSLFSQQGTDVIVNYPKGGYGNVIFINGELPKDEDLDFYSQGAKGFQLLEYADGKEVQNSKIREYRMHLLALSIKNPQLAAIKRRNFEEMLKQYGSENLRVEYDYKEKEWVVEGYKQEPFDYPSIEIMGRDGGYALNILMRIGFE